MSGKGGDQKLTVFYFEQLLDPQYWQWAVDDPAQAAALAAAIPKPGATVDELRAFAEYFGGFLVAKLEAYGVHVAECHLNVHHLDVTPEGRVKAIHIHGIVKFAGGRQGGLTLPNIALALGLEQQYVEKPNRGGKSVEGRSQSHDNALAYLIHIKYSNMWPFPHPYDAATAQAAAAKITPEGFIEGKWPYDPAQVATVRGEDYLTIYDKRLPDWLKGRAYVKAQAAKIEAEWLREECLQGRLTLAQIHLTDALYDVYARNKRVIDEALATYGERRAFRAAKALEDDAFKTQVVYVQGSSESGKTYAAKKYAAKVQQIAADRGQRWDMARTASSNSLDDYHGEEILFINEARADAMKAADWLALLDPDDAGPASARYRNKGVIAPRVILITNTQTPEEYFYYVRSKGDVDEAMSQFIRRLAAVVHVVATDTPDGDIQRSYGFREVIRSERYFYEFEQTSPTGARQRVRFALEHEFTDETTHSFEGVLGRLAQQLAERFSTDVGFDRSPSWPQIVETALKELAAQPRRAIEPAVIEGEVIADDATPTVEELRAELERVSASVEAQRADEQRRRRDADERARDARVQAVRDAGLDLAVLASTPDPYALNSALTVPA